MGVLLLILIILLIILIYLINKTIGTLLGVSFAGLIVHLNPDKIIGGGYKVRFSGYEYNKNDGLENDSRLKAIVNRGGLKLSDITHMETNPKKLEYYTMIDKSFPRKPYKKEKNHFRPVLHWGQLKLFLSEVELLNLIIAGKINNTGKPPLLLYVGAAPGNHTNFLSDMYPDVKFDLWDGQPFVCRETDRIKIHNNYFFNEDAERYVKQGYMDKYFTILVSDIRRASDEETVKGDMAMQLDWWKAMKPDLAMFKFRLPWSGGITEYPEGDIYTQAFPGTNSSEMRLIFKGDAKLIAYDNRKYEEQCFYHNQERRGQCFNHPKFPNKNYSIEKDGFDNCYDCIKMITLIDEYLTLIKKPNQESDIRKFIKVIEKEISQGKRNIRSETKRTFDQALLLANSRA